MFLCNWSRIQKWPVSRYGLTDFKGSTRTVRDPRLVATIYKTLMSVKMQTSAPIMKNATIIGKFKSNF